jgi:Zn-dependent M28 family amino/carboxypeptidase
VVFVAVCGEEKGLLGSRYFAEHPTVTDGPMLADIHLDMFLPLFPLERLFAYGLEESTLANQMQQVAKDFHVMLQPIRRQIATYSSEAISTASSGRAFYRCCSGLDMRRGHRREDSQSVAA